MNYPSLHILLADDDADDCWLFQQVLTDTGIQAEVTIVRDGERLIEWLNNNLAARPDIIFMDINMPKKNGLQCMMEITQDLQLQQIPVVIMSTSYDLQIAEELRSNGARYYIQKPPDFEQLKLRVNEALARIFTAGNTNSSNDLFVLQGNLSILL